MRQQLKLESIENVDPVSTITTTPQNCFSRQMFIELDRNEQLKLQLMKAEQTIEELKSKASSPNFPHTDISFKDTEGMKEPSAEAAIWKQNYENLIKYISKHMEDAQFLVQKYENMKNECRKYKSKTMELKQKEKRWSEEEDHLIQKLEETIQSSQVMINDLINAKMIQNSEIVQLQQEINMVQRQQQKENEIYLKEIERRQERLKEYQHKIQTQQKQISILNQKIYAKQKQIDILSQQTNAKYKQISTLNQQINAKEDNYENNIRSLLKLHKSQLAQKNQYCAKMQKMREQALALYQKGRKEQEHLSESHEEEKATFENMISSLHEKIQLQERQFKRQFGKLMGMKNQIHAENKQIKYDKLNKEAEIAKLQNITADLELRLNQKEWQIEQLKQIKGIEEKKFLQLEQKNVQLLSDIETIIEQLKIRQLQIQKLEKEKFSQTYILQPSAFDRQNESQSLLGLKGCESIENIEVERKEKGIRQSKFSLQAFQKKIEKESKRKFFSNRKIR